MDGSLCQNDFVFCLLQDNSFAETEFPDSVKKHSQGSVNRN